MNLAILLSGLHYVENYKNHVGTCTVDYRKYVKNIKTKIYGHFENYQIDTFISTNESKLLQEYINTYSVVDYVTNNIIHTEDFEIANKKITVLKLLISHIEKTKKEYDLVLLTRPDIYIMEDLSNFCPDKLNIVSILERDFYCDDNLFIFPIKYLYVIYDLIIQNYNNYSKGLLFHSMKNIFEEHMEVHYLHNNYSFVRDLSFFKLRFLENPEFILNRFLFTDNVLYENKNASIKINEVIEFNKIHDGHFCWIGYDMVPGKYNLTFKIFSDKDINFEFIKTHNPVQFFKIPDIPNNTWTDVSVDIEIFNYSLVCFIFDNYPEPIKIKYKNILFT
jgi:hypothetical protein